MTQGPSTPAIVMRGVFAGIAGAAGALSDLNLRLEPGNLLAFSAPRPERETFLALLSRRIAPERGSVCLFGRDLWLLGPDEARRIVTRIRPWDNADAGLSPWQIVSRACLPEGRLWGTVKAPRDRDRIAEALHRMDLTRQARQNAASLTGEERQRVMIAQALVHRPGILLCDLSSGGFPGSAGDAGRGMRLPGALRDEGVTLVVTLAGPESARGVADLILAPGQEPSSGETYEIPLSLTG